MVKFAADTKWYQEFKALVALRPNMFLGRLNSYGLYELLKGVLSSIIFFSDRKGLFIDISRINSKTYQIKAKGMFQMRDTSFDLAPGLDFFHIYLLCATSSSYKLTIHNSKVSDELIFENGNVIRNSGIINHSDDEIELQFVLNDTFFKTYPDYYELNELCYELATLNKHIRIFLEDKSEPFSNLNQYHFPQGLKYLLERSCSKAFHFLDVIFIDEFVNGNYFQIGIAFQQKTYSNIHSISYAGYGRTIEGGDLENGIVSGMMDVRKKYRKKDLNLEDDKYSKYHFKGRLIIVCQVVSQDNTYSYWGGNKG